MRINIRRIASVAAVAVLLPLTACDTDDLLEITDPDRVTEGTLDDASQSSTVIAGAISEFNRAFSGGGGDAFTSNVALFTDELQSSGSFTTRTATDRRLLFPPADGNTHDVAYRRLQRSRRATKDAAEFLVKFDLQSGPEWAQMKEFEGFSIVALAEGFCGPIPFSDVVDGVREDGIPISNTEAFNNAIVRFDQAIARDGAKMGKGRALLALGQYAAAAAAVSSVPTDFFEVVEHSSNSGGQNNPVWALQSNGRYTVGDGEGSNGMLFRTGHQAPLVGDPRSQWWEDGDGGFISTIRLFVTRRHNQRGSNAIIADGIEARLIEAEADLNANNDVAWLATLNELRVEVHNLLGDRVDDYAANLGTNPDINENEDLLPLAMPATFDGRVDLMFQERAFWLYLQGRRLGDMRRLVNQYGRTQNTVYPTGVYSKGGVHGDDVVFNLDFDEINNLNYNPALCDTKSTAF